MKIRLCPPAKGNTGNLQGNLGDSCCVGVFIYLDLFAFKLYLGYDPKDYMEPKLYRPYSKCMCKILDTIKSRKSSVII